MASTGKSEKRRSSSAGFALGAAALGAVGAGVAFLLRQRSPEHDEDQTGDAPKWTRNSKNQGAREVVGRTVTIDRPRQALFDVWSDFTRFPSFMDNVRSVERIDDKRSRWTIEAPAGQSVTLVTRITEVVPGTSIYWQSEPESDIATSGKVEFRDAPPGRGTYVSLVLSYEPPVGTLGKLAAKLFQREPAIQARRDLRRFKQLMETGEITSSAGPSARAEDPTKQYA